MWIVKNHVEKISTGYLVEGEEDFIHLTNYFFSVVLNTFKMFT